MLYKKIFVFLSTTLLQTAIIGLLLRYNFVVEGKKPIYYKLLHLLQNFYFWRVVAIFLVAEDYQKQIHLLQNTE